MKHQENVGTKSIKINIKITMTIKQIDFENLGITVDDLKFYFKIVEMDKLKAIVSIDFGDFKIKGFRVNASDYENENGEKLWITPPSYRDAGGRYHPIFFTSNKELWKKIESKLLDEYHKASKEHYKKRFDLDDEQ